MRPWLADAGWNADVKAEECLRHFVQQALHFTIPSQPATSHTRAYFLNTFSVVYLHKHNLKEKTNFKLRTVFVSEFNSLFQSFTSVSVNEVLKSTTHMRHNAPAC